MSDFIEHSCKCKETWFKILNTGLMKLIFDFWWFTSIIHRINLIYVLGWRSVLDVPYHLNVFVWNECFLVQNPINDWVPWNFVVNVTKEYVSMLNQNTSWTNLHLPNFMATLQEVLFPKSIIAPFIIRYKSWFLGKSHCLKILIWMSLSLSTS